MKYCIRLALITLIFFIAGLPAVFAQNSYVVSGNPNAPPVVWEQHKQLVGLGPDLAKSILDDLDIYHAFALFDNWRSVQSKAREGKVDLIVSAYKNREREEYLSFSIPYLSQPIVIVVEKGNEFDFSSWDKLKGKKGVSNVGESYGQDFDDFIKQHLSVKYHQFERAIQLLNLGEADYLVVDLYTALIYARLLQGEDRITILDPPVTTQNFHLAVRTDSDLAARLPDIDKKLGELIDNGMVSKSLMKHYDNWRKLIDKRSSYYAKGKESRSKDQQAYLKKQDEMARQRIIGTMVNREGLPAAAQ